MAVGEQRGEDAVDQIRLTDEDLVDLAEHAHGPIGNWPGIRDWRCRGGTFLHDFQRGDGINEIEVVHAGDSARKMGA